MVVELIVVCNGEVESRGGRAAVCTPYPCLWVHVRHLSREDNDNEQNDMLCNEGYKEANANPDAGVVCAHRVVEGHLEETEALG